MKGQAGASCIIKYFNQIVLYEKKDDCFYQFIYNVCFPFYSFYRV